MMMMFSDPTEEICEGKELEDVEHLKGETMKWVGDILNILVESWTLYSIGGKENGDVSK